MFVVRALLTLTAIEPRPGPKATLLAAAFGLTPGEARLASVIAEGLNPERRQKHLVFLASQRVISLRRSLQKLRRIAKAN
jgi:hypothetical protein